MSEQDVVVLVENVYARRSNVEAAEEPPFGDDDVIVTMAFTDDRLTTELDLEAVPLFTLSEYVRLASKLLIVT